MLLPRLFRFISELVFSFTHLARTLPGQAKLTLRCSQPTPSLSRCQEPPTPAFRKQSGGKVKVNGRRWGRPARCQDCTKRNEICLVSAGEDEWETRKYGDTKRLVWPKPGSDFADQAQKSRAVWSDKKAKGPASLRGLFYIQSLSALRPARPWLDLRWR